MKQILIILTIIILSISCKKEIQPKEIKKEKAFSTAESGLYMRKTPSRKAKILKILQYNTEFIIIEYSKIEETIDGIRAPWVKINVEDSFYDQTIEGWVFGGFISKDKPLNKEEIKNETILTTIKALEKSCRINIGPGPLGFLYFHGDNEPKYKNIQIDVPIGGEESYIENIEYKKDAVILKIKHNTFDEDSMDSKIIKTEFYRCDISKELLLNAYNNKDGNTKYRCILEK